MNRIRRIPSPMAVLAVVVALACAASSLVPAVAAPAGEREEIPIDDIVRMLEGGLSPGVVVAWLDSRDESIEAPEPEDLLRLREAGADDALLREIIDRSKPYARGEPAYGRHAPASAPDGSESVRIVAEIEYRPVGELDGDERAATPDLVLYLDGRRIARVEPQPDLGRVPVRAAIDVVPGRHVLEWSAVGPGDRTERLSPDTATLDVAAGRPWTLRFRWLESPMALGRPEPLSWTLARDGEVAAEGGGTVAPRDRWMEACDDVRAEIEAGEEPGKALRRRLERCVDRKGPVSEIQEPGGD